MQPSLAPSIAERLGRAVRRHPVHEFFAHRRRLALVRQLAGYLKAGVGLPVAIGEMARFASRASERRRIAAVAAEIENGAGLATALRGVGLDELTTTLLAAAEETGTIDRLFQATIARLEAAQAARWQFAKGLIHPAYLVALLIFLAPLLSLGAALRRGWTLDDLPWLYVRGLGRNLLGASVLGLAGLALPLLPAIANREAPWDRWSMRLPLVGPLLRQIYASRLLSVLSTALGAGTNAARAVELAVRATASPHLSSLAAATARALEGGRPLGDALGQLGILDGPTLGALAVAERTGELDTIPARLGAELAQAAARRLRTLLAIAVAVVVAILLVKVVIATVMSFVGTLRSLDEDLDKLTRP